MEENTIESLIQSQSSKREYITRFCFTAIELGPPDAHNPCTLFDWQKTSDLTENLKRFGGLDNIVNSLETDLIHGLTTEKFNDPERIQKYGSNKAQERKSQTYCEIIWQGLHDFTLVILICAAVVSIITGMISEGPKTGWIDGLAILVAVALILNVTAINDLQKDKQFRQLNAINNKKQIKAVRNGEIIEIYTDDIVVGDVLFITAGDTIPGDIIYLRGTNVKMDESKLTGESEELKKTERDPFIVSSSECHDGSFYGLVVAVGDYSVFGRMKTMIQASAGDLTPLQIKLDNLTTQISVVGATVGVLVVFIMLIIHLVQFFNGNGTVDSKGKPDWTNENWNAVVNFFITGVTILVVAIPEGLPLAVTIALAYSVQKMMVDNNLVRHLSACETMGGANTVCSDKTGTLTMGKMTVMQGWVLIDHAENEVEYLNKFEKLDKEERDDFIERVKDLDPFIKDLFVENSCLNNDAFLINEVGKSERGSGSSLDIALIKFTRELGDEFEYNNIRQMYPKIENLSQTFAGACIMKSYPFHSNRKRSSIVIRKRNGKFRIYVKGAPEILVRLCDNAVTERGKIFKMDGDFSEDAEGRVIGQGSRFKLVKHCIVPMARTGLRVIAFAYRDIDEAMDWEETVEYKTEDQKGMGPCPVLESHLTLIGLIGVQDPPRPEVPESVKNCQKAGIFVRMVTGDNIETAKAIATQVHIYHRDGYTDGQGKRWPPGKCITGPQFREAVGGLVLPPHFYHDCNCRDLSSSAAYRPGYLTPKYPIHYGYPSIVAHNSEECKYWKTKAKKKGCNDECRQRGCAKLMKKEGDKIEESKYLVIKNQFVFDQYVDTLQVMARSAPTDKHMLVSGLMERRLVVAVTGDGTNDGPALSKSNVGFAMGIAGTSVAKDASDIILMDDNFTSIVKAVLWGRNVYDSIRKFLQFQLTINCVACFLAFISACIIKESPLKPIQMLWVNLIMDSFASLALATESPTIKLLDRPPYHRDESLISKTMLRNILSHFFFQFTVVIIYTFYGNEILDVPIGIHLPPTTDPSKHLTMVFNTFVVMQVFNEINSRKINNELNVFKDITKSYMFIIIVFGTIGIQIIIVTFGGIVLSCARLSVVEHCISVLIGFFGMIVTQIVRIIPSHWFLDLASNARSASNSFEYLRRARSRLYKSNVTSVIYEQTLYDQTRIFTK